MEDDRVTNKKRKLGELSEKVEQITPMTWVDIPDDEVSRREREADFDDFCGEFWPQYKEQYVKLSGGEEPTFTDMKLDMNIQNAYTLCCNDDARWTAYLCPCPFPVQFGRHSK